EPAQRVLALLSDRFRAPVVRTLGLTRILALRGDVVTALRCQHDLVAVCTEHFLQDRLAGAVRAIDGRGVDEVDARVERGVDHRLRIIRTTPPVGDERPRTEPNLGDDEITVSEPAKTHGSMVSTSSSAASILPCGGAD